MTLIVNNNDDEMILHCMVPLPRVIKGIFNKVLFQ